MDVKPTFSLVEMKQAFGGMIQEVDLEPSKQYIDLERYLFDLVEYLQPELVKNLGESDGGIYLFLSVDVKYNNPCQRYGNDDDEFDDDEPFTLHSGKLYIKNLDQIADKLERAARNISVENEGPIRGMTNLVIGSIGNACYKEVKKSKPEHWLTESWHQEA